METLVRKGLTQPENCCLDCPSHTVSVVKTLFGGFRGEETKHLCGWGEQPWEITNTLGICEHHPKWTPMRGTDDD